MNYFFLHFPSKYCGQWACFAAETIPFEVKINKISN